MHVAYRSNIISDEEIDAHATLFEYLRIDMVYGLRQINQGLRTGYLRKLLQMKTIEALSLYLQFHRTSTALSPVSTRAFSNFLFNYV